MNIDVITESKEITRYIHSRIETASNEIPIQHIEFGFQIDQEGLFCMYLDTRKNAGSDGSWTLAMEGNCLKRQHWPALLNEYDEIKLAEIMGDLIRKVVLRLRDKGVFNRLKKSDNCEFGIEDINGHYGWPSYKDKGRKNKI